MNPNRGKKNSLSSESEHDDIWDDTLIIRNYEESLAMVKEVVAKRLAMKTNKKYAQTKVPVKSEQLAEAGTSSSSALPAASSSQEPKREQQDEEESSGVEGSTGGVEKGEGESVGSKPVYKVGDYCRATYEDDGVDYEAKIMAIGKDQGVLIRFIGYNNEQTATLDDLVPSWGRKARRKQREDAAEEAAEADSHRMEISDDEEKLTKKASKIRINYGPGFSAQSSSSSHAATAFGAGMGASFMVPPPPPMPPMLEHEDDLESENLSAMLMSWYMSGYYTGLYHGQKMSQKRARPS
uniref:Putative mrna splicing protein smn survival motor neuron n=1 Tax=Culex tarsalis TaxID=7177 RepID=A0A1Q3F1P5_CULTA